MEKEKVMNREEWLRKYKVFKQCQEKDCKYECDECECEEGSRIYKSEILAEAKKIFETQIEEEKMRNLLIGLQLGHIENSVSDVQLKRIKEYTQNIENILLNGAKKYE